MDSAILRRRVPLAAASSVLLASLLVAACGSGQPDQTSAAAPGGAGAVSDTTAPPGVAPQGGPGDPKSQPAPGEPQTPVPSAEGLAAARAQVATDEFSVLCSAPDGSVTVHMWEPARDGSGAPRSSSEEMAQSFEAQGRPGTTCETSEAVAAELHAEEGVG